MTSTSVASDFSSLAAVVFSAAAVGTVPLDRDFGVPVDLIDKPMPVAQAKLTAQIVKAVHKYEPRAAVKRVTYTGDADGRLVPKLEVEIDVG